jgi:hypothetical protein
MTTAMPRSLLALVPEGGTGAILPITPSGLGITKFGLVAILAAGASHRVSAQVTAAVLLWRTVTYGPHPARRGRCLVRRHAPALIHTSPGNAGPASMRGVDDTCQSAPKCPERMR